MRLRNEVSYPLTRREVMVDGSDTARTLLRAGIVGLLLAVTWQGTWFELEGRGVYTEGIDREPTIWANYTIDAEEERIGIEFTNATPLLIYLNERESLVEEDFELLSACESGCVNGARELLKFSFVMTVIAALVDMRFGKRRWFAMIPATAILLMLVVMPLAAFGDFGMNSDESATGGFGSGNSDSVSAEEFVHTEESSGFGLGFDGFSVTFGFAGYDLGLIEEENRSAAIESPPESDDSWIGFEGKLTASWGDIVLPLFGVPLTLFVLRSKSEIPQNEAVNDSSPTSEEE